MKFVSTANISEKGVVSLRCEEGEKLHAYHDTRGILSIGVGHSIHAPSNIPFHADTVWTQTQVDSVFMRDLAPIVRAANDDLERAVNQHQFDAIISLEYNIGMGGLRMSHLIDVINHHGAGEVRVEDFLAWAHPTALKGRRMREWEMYSNGIYRTA